MLGIKDMLAHKPMLFLCLGVSMLLITLVIPSPFEGMSESAWRAIGVASLMAIWWTGGAAPIPVTALLPLVIAPALNILSIEKLSSAYAHPLIFLFLGGFMLSIAMEKSQLHRRIALKTLSYVGDNPAIQIAGVMLVTAFLSMWMSNTATAVMMLPIGLSVISLLKKEGSDSTQFANALLLGIAYSASIGGIATLIGTPPNALLAAYLTNNYGIRIGFAQWMLIGLPLSMVMLTLAWLWLTRGAYQLSRSGVTATSLVVQAELKELPPLRRSEKLVAIIFMTTACLWMTRPLLEKFLGLQISDPGIAILAGVSLFLIPSGEKENDKLLNWENTQQLPWGVLLLFGGGLALAAIINDTGLGVYVADAISQQGDLPLWALILLVTGTMIFLTEVTSNTATAAGFLPLLGPISENATGSPLMLTIPAALAASCAFMLPVATPPNSVVFASGEIKISDMVKAGFMLNIVCALIISLSALFVVRIFL